MIWFVDPPHPVRIDTQRLILTSPRNRDFKDWSALRQQSEAHLRPWEPAWSDHPHSRKDWKARFRVWSELEATGRGYVLHIRKREDRQLIGSVSLTNIQFAPIQTARIGYWLGAGFTGAGLMTEAVSAVCDWAFDTLDLIRIEAGTLPENTPSQAVLLRAGFQKEGYGRAYLQINGVRRDHLLFAKIREEGEASCQDDPDNRTRQSDD